MSRRKFYFIFYQKTNSFANQFLFSLSYFLLASGSLLSYHFLEGYRKPSIFVKTNSFRFLKVSVLLLCFFTVQVIAQEGKIEKTFKNVKEVRIKTVSGNCIVQKGDKNEVKIVVTYSYDDEDYDAEIEQRGDRLILRERFVGHRRSWRGRSTWKLTVPENTDIEFSTASGEFEAADLSSNIEAQTASGNISLKRMNGDFNISTASGDIEITDLQGRIEFGTASGNVELRGFTGDSEVGTASGNIRAENVRGEMNFGTASGNIYIRACSGEFEVGAASGDVDASNVVIEGRSNFSAASGDVDVSLGKELAHNLKISSASGDSRLRFNGHTIRGFIEMTAKAGRGRIKAPFKFDNEEFYYKWNDEYVTKSVTKGNANPRIEISTASGRAVLEN